MRESAVGELGSAADTVLVSIGSTTWRSWSHKLLTSRRAAKQCNHNVYITVFADASKKYFCECFALTIRDELLQHFRIRYPTRRCCSPGGCEPSSQARLVPPPVSVCKKRTANIPGFKALQPTVLNPIQKQYCKIKFRCLKGSTYSTMKLQSQVSRATLHKKHSVYA